MIRRGQRSSQSSSCSRSNQACGPCRRCTAPSIPSPAPSPSAPRPRPSRTWRCRGQTSWLLDRNSTTTSPRQRNVSRAPLLVLRTKQNSENAHPAAMPTTNLSTFLKLKNGTSWNSGSAQLPGRAIRGHATDQHVSEKTVVVLPYDQKIFTKGQSPVTRPSLSRPPPSAWYRTCPDPAVRLR